jgi:hypothetical protein
MSLYQNNAAKCQLPKTANRSALALIELEIVKFEIGAVVNQFILATYPDLT